MNVADILESEILHRIEKPSRYLGNELNAVHKASDTVDVRMALAFPDLYDLGLGNLGIHILYACVNKLPWAWCERAFAPAPDMERQLRERGLPLFALESKDSLADLDMVGFTLQSELTYTNILNMIDLGGMALRSADRGENDPLLCAGGPAVFNPEPMAPFLDFFVIGDGEDAIVEIAEVLRAHKGRCKADKLAALAELEGVYVPALYPFDTLEDGRILPALDAPKIRKRTTKELDGATFPTDYIVPFTELVHDRISLEVLRGCTQGCRFCQAGMTTRPVRERSLENVDELMQKTLDNTGYEEVSLVSLSTCDYSRVRQLVENTVERASPQRVSVSLPSLRLDSFSVELADMVADIRRTGLTVAPEAASPRLRAVINKWIPDEGLLEMSQGAFERGWRHVKLYFMIGLPTERDDDILAIADLAKRTVHEGRRVKQNARVNLGVSTFVPKPFTPFQWSEQIDRRETIRRQDILANALHNHGSIKFGRHDPEETFLEGLVSRGDRRVADLLEAAFRKGCRFDAWREHLRFDWWLEAIEEVGHDVANSLRAREIEERLPWDHIDVLVDKAWLVADWERAKLLEHAEDCRHKKCHKCGVIDQVRPLCASMLRNSIQGREPETAWKRKERTPYVEPEPVQRVVLRIARTGQSRYLGHLEFHTAWLRALRRAKIPLSYSQGFHPQPRMAFSAALPLGQESLGEYLDLTLTDRVEPEELLTRLRAKLAAGFEAIAITEIPVRHKRSLMSQNQGGEYVLFFDESEDQKVRERVAALNKAAEIVIERKGKARRKGSKRHQRRQRVVRNIDIRPMIRRLAMDEGYDGVSVELTVVMVDDKPGKAREVVALLSDDPESVRVLKRDTLTCRDGQWESISARWQIPDARSVDTSDANPLGSHR